MAAGGTLSDWTVTDKVELLEIDDTGNDNNVSVSDTWKEGPRMPTTLTQASSTTTDDQTILFVAGGVMSNDPYSMSPRVIYSLRCTNIGYCIWTKVDTELMIVRADGVALLIPPEKPAEANNECMLTLCCIAYLKLLFYVVVVACEPDWVGDGDCDSVNNNAECEFDGGDCCSGDDQGCLYCYGDWCKCHQTGEHHCTGDWI